MEYYHIGNQKPKSQIVAEQLRELILGEKKYQPHDQLPNEQVLAEHMGVSRTSIREAVKILVADGILTIRRGIGTFVSPSPGSKRDPYGFSSMEPDKIKLVADWYQFRISIEPLAMELVAQNATESDLILIRELALEHNEHMSDGHIHMDTDRRFHMQLAVSTHNIIMAKLLPSLHDSLYWAVADVVASPAEHINEIFNDIAREGHLKVVEFLEMRDGPAAALEMRYHIHRGIKELRKLYPKHFRAVS